MLSESLCKLSGAMLILRCVCHALFPLALLLTLGGCQQGSPDTAAVQGIVTLDGHPVHGATITFIPSKPWNATLKSTTDASGQYQLTIKAFQSAELPGPYSVLIESTALLAEQKAEHILHGKDFPEHPIALPERFGTEGQLSAEIRRGQNQIDFRLMTR